MNETPQIRDIVPPVDVFPYPIWLVAAGAIAAALIVVLIVWLVIRLIPRKQAPPPMPHAVALAALQRGPASS